MYTCVYISAKAANHYRELSVEKNVSFNISVLRPLLMLCSRQTASKPIPCPCKIAQRIMKDLYELYCKNKRTDKVSLIFDLLNTMHTLANYNKINELSWTWTYNVHVIMYVHVNMHVHVNMYVHVHVCLHCCIS